MRAGGLLKDPCPGSGRVISVNDTTRIVHCHECGRALDVQPRRAKASTESSSVFKMSGSLLIPVPQAAVAAWEATLATHSRYSGTKA